MCMYFEVALSAVVSKGSQRVPLILIHIYIYI